MSSNTPKLLLTTQTTLTSVWNDSCSIAELEYAIKNGATGATTNPSIVGQVLLKEFDQWEDYILQSIKDNPTASEVDIAWKVNEAMALKGAELLLPLFKKSEGLQGRMSIQTNAQLYRNTEAMAKQAIYFDSLAENLQVKMPVTEAGVAAIEESTYHGVNVNATVSFSTAQAIAVAEAVERGLKRREAEGKPTEHMTPACTIMVGRVDDWLKIVQKKENIAITPGALEWAGVAVFKKSYGLYQERGYRTRLLSAAYRNHLHWSEFIGGDVILTIPHTWQVRFNNSDVEVTPRMDTPVNPAIIEELKRKMPEFVKAYDEDGMKPADFVNYGATARTLRGFLDGYAGLVAKMRDIMIPNPDK